jgi:hypothetical protein
MNKKLNMNWTYSLTKKMMNLTFTVTKDQIVTWFGLATSQYLTFLAFVISMYGLNLVSVDSRYTLSQECELIYRILNTFWREKQWPGQGLLWVSNACEYIYYSLGWQLVRLPVS